MLEVVKIGGIWQIWNVTCDGSIIVENGHRNMGFFEKTPGEKLKEFVEALKAIKPVFSLNIDLLKIVIDSDLEQNPNGFHVFDYAQLQKANINIDDYVHVIDFRLGSFVISKRSIFTAERIADELDAYPGHPFLIRHLRGQTPAPVEPTETFKVIIPYPDDVKAKLLESSRESWYGDYGQRNKHKLEEQVENYIDTYCYPDLDLKISIPYCSN